MTKQDAVEKVLNSLIDSMHAHVAKSNRSVNVSKAVTQAVKTEAVESKEPIKEKAEPSLFDKFLSSSKPKKGDEGRQAVTLLSKQAKPKKAKH